MKYLLVLLLSISNVYPMAAQNLVMDSSFETLENLTNRKGNWYGILGTPDLWDTSGFCATPRMISVELQRSAHRGKKYLGLYNEKTYQEAVSGVLSELLKKDSIYEIAIYVKSGDKGGTGYGCTFNTLKEFHVTFSTDDYNWEKQPYLALSPSNKQSINNKWLRISGFYKAQGGENRIILGGYKGINIQGNDNCVAYYYFDDVVVQSSSAHVIPKMNKIQEDTIATDLSTIYFDTNSEAITESEKSKLQSNIKILNDNKNLSITIGGFTDSDGSDSYNIKLGERRAKNVKDYLLQNGYQDNDNITIKSFGKISSSNAASKAKNRRVELFFTPKSLNASQKEAIVAASKLYGYVRWFYPTDVLDNFNWDKFLNKTIIQISTIKERIELRKYIISRFSSIAPELRFFNDIHTTLNYKKTIKFNNALIYKKKVNEGMGQANNKVYDSQLVDCKITVNGFSAPYKGKNYTFKEAEWVDSLPLSISLYCPLVLPYQKYSVDKIRNDSLTHTMSDTLPKYSWLTSSIMVWNTVQHFYPYLDVLKINWQPKMNDLVEKLNQTTSENEYVTIMKSLVVQINDGHAGFNNMSIASDMWLPFTLSIVNNKLVVSKSYDPNIKVNDELIKMDGIDCIEKFNQDTALISGTKNHKKDKVLSGLTAINKYGTFSHLLVKRNSTLIETDVKRDWPDDTTKAIQYLTNNLIYVDCSHIQWHDIDSLLNKMNNSKGVIFDMREYLTDDGLVNLLSHLLQTRDTANSWMQQPIYLFPNQKNVIYNKEGWELEPKNPYLSCPVVFLAGGSSISYNESMLGLIKHYKLGKIIGEKTAGSNGSRNWIDLPNNYFFAWTGMYVTMPNGSALQGVGIEPDILALPNPQLSSYEDYILNTAIQYLTNK